MSSSYFRRKEFFSRYKNCPDWEIRPSLHMSPNTGSLGLSFVSDSMFMAILGY
jgi:hypothetical protein